ncbi:MAG: DNA polymerase III subunit [Eubacterium sp.]|nr:DNA polymerase III subunit [Eubacterium sp.]MBR3174035.1 DNA polymerase III subunit [Eubacterium sp.]
MERALGQNHIYEHFKNAIAAGKLSHAYILHGERGMGKLNIAKEAAKAIQCESNAPEQTDKTGEACGQCKSCHQAESDNQPDIKYVTPAKKTLGVDDIREQINDDALIKPYGSPYKIYIIPKSDTMTVQAQNALLKTIEEPPSYAIFILLAANTDAFLPTILSRCVMLNAKTVSEGEIVKELKSKFGVGDYDAKVAASFAGGNIGKAEKLISSDSFKDSKDSVTDLIRNVANGGMDVIAKTVKDLNDYKDDKEALKDYLDMIRVWFGDVLKFKTTKDDSELVFQESLVEIKQLADHVSFENINGILDEIEKAEERTKSNVGFDSNMEVMLLGIKERLQ